MKRFALLLVFYVFGICLLSAGMSDIKRYTVTHGLLNNQVCQLVELPDGQILVGTEGAFNLFDGRRFHTIPCRFDSLYQLPSFGTQSHLWEGDSLLWLKDFHWLYLYDARRQCFRYDYGRRVSETEIQRFVTARIDSQIARQREMLFPKRQRLDSILGTPLSEQHPLTSYLCDRQGGEWFGIGGEGIVYVSPYRPGIKAVHVDIKGSPKRMAEVDDRHFLLGTTEGIYLIDREQMRTERVIVEGGVHCMDMKKDKQGRVFVSTTGGLYLYDGGEVTHYHQGNVDGFVHMPVRFALPLSDGRILVCNLLHHLGYFYPSERRFCVLNERLPQLNAYRTLVEAIPLQETGKVLVTTQNGAFILDTACDTLCQVDSVALFYAYSQKFNSALIDSEGRFWLGTHNGLLCDGRRLTCDEGLSNSSIRSITEAPDGSIWVGTSAGVNRIKDDEILSLGTSDGLPEEEVEERGALIMSDGTAYFAAGNALLTFPTSSYDRHGAVLPVVLTRVQVMNKRVVSPDSVTLTLPYDRNYIHFQFSALNYSAPEHVRYRYRLQNFDSQWLLANNENGAATAAYNALPPGHYRFQLQCALAGGAWGPVLSKDVIISPPWWQSWWFRLICCLLLAATIVVVVHVYWKHQKERLARANEERVNRMFEVRDKARRHFARQLDVSPARLAMNVQEEDLVSRLMKVIEQNMGNTEYSVEQMARDVSMERTGLYRKLQSIVGITPSEFLRSVRLKRAAQLLESHHELSITEISQQVGFTSSRHFSTCFKQMFGCTPSDYRKDDD